MKLLRMLLTVQQLLDWCCVDMEAAVGSEGGWGASLVLGLLGVSPHSSPKSPSESQGSISWATVSCSWGFLFFHGSTVCSFFFTLIAFLSLSVAATYWFFTKTLNWNIIIFFQLIFCFAQSFQFLLSFLEVKLLMWILPQIVLWFFNNTDHRIRLLPRISFSCIWKSSPPWLHLSITSSSMY